MSERRVELFLFDIYVAILKIEKTVEKFKNSEELLHDFNAWDSVIREFEIIGEAARHLIDSNILDENARVVVDFRNLLIYNYFGIDPEEVWDVVVNDLPYFTNDILEQINKIEEPLKKDLIEAYSEHNKYLDFVIEKLKAL